MNLPDLKSVSNEALDAGRASVDQVRNMTSTVSNDAFEAYDAVRNHLNQRHKITYSTESISRIPETIIETTREVGKGAIGILDLHEARRQREHIIRRKNATEAIKFLDVGLGFVKLVRLFT